MKKTLIPLGPFHPLLEEAEYYSLYVDGETVVDVDLRIGYMHRGHEKLSEQKTFDQSIFLGLADCQVNGKCHHYLPQAVITIYDGTHRCLPFHLDVRSQVIPAFLQSSAIRGQAENSVTVHTPQIGFDHPNSADASMIVQNAEGAEY